MHNILYENQDQLAPPSLMAFATAIGLEKFSDELKSRVHLGKVRDDFLSGVRGTPTFFISGWRHDASWDLPNLLGALQAAAVARNAA